VREPRAAQDPIGLGGQLVGTHALQGALHPQEVAVQREGNRSSRYAVPQRNGSVRAVIRRRRSRSNARIRSARPSRGTVAGVYPSTHGHPAPHDRARADGDLLRHPRRALVAAGLLLAVVAALTLLVAVDPTSPPLLARLDAWWRDVVLPPPAWAEALSRAMKVLARVW